MEVQQALICAGGLGTRLGLGTKSLIIYKGKLILEYLLISCCKAGIKNVVVVTIPKKYERYLSEEKLKLFNDLKRKYSDFMFIRDTGHRSFRKVPNYVRKYLNTSKPFFLICGHSPQASSFLRKIGSCYESNTLVTSGYRYRYDSILSTGLVGKNKMISISNFEYKKPKPHKCLKRNEFVQHFPYVMDYEFYDNFIKKDGYKNRVEFYPKKFLESGGTVKILRNPVEISEIDFRKDLTKLKSSIDFINKTEKYW